MEVHIRLIIFEQQVLKIIGPGQRSHDLLLSPAVVLSKAEHEAITKKLGKVITDPSGMTKKEILQAYENAYKDHPQWINEVRCYFQ